LKDRFFSRKPEKLLIADLLSAITACCHRLSRIFRCQVLTRLIESRFPRPAIIAFLNTYGY
jgi:hypothetical protein